MFLIPHSVRDLMNHGKAQCDLPLANELFILSDLQEIQNDKLQWNLRRFEGKAAAVFGQAVLLFSWRG